jgi:YD repeat-containing protein
VVDFDVTTQVVEDLSYGSTVSGVGQVDAPESTNWDCAIGDLTFLLAMSDQYPFRRETAEFRRQRIDTERNPGEQSLDSGYWIRSQSSWHYGSGLTSAEPLEVNNDEAQFRYKEGGGVNPWTPGQLSLLNDTASVLSSAGSGQLLLGVDTGVLHADGAVLTYIAADGTTSTVTWGGSGSIKSMTTDGENYYVADTTGIYKGALPTGSGSLIWNTGANPVIRWVKSRLMATVGAAVYELTGTGPSLPTPLDPGTARPTGWTWTDISEGPAAIYLSGFVGDTSTIERIGVSATTSAVTLDVPVVVADMPRGETVLSTYSYVGSFLIVGTTLGARVALINSDGSLSLGPIVVDAAAVDDAVAIENYVYVTVRDQGNAGDRAYRAGLYRIDLGQVLNQSSLDFAHAADLVAPAGTTGDAVQVTSAGGYLYFAVDTQGVFKQQDTFVSEGWLESGRIRLGTVENKGWRDLRLLTKSGEAGTVTGYADTSETGSPSSWTTVITADGDRTDTSGKLTAAAPAPQSNLYVAFSLTSADSNTSSPVFIGYQVRAVPAPERTRLLQVPILLFDFITDRKGLRVGKRGFAWDTLQKLQDLEQSTAVVQWRDFTTGEAATAYVERVSFTRTSPPTNRASGVGGVGQVLLRLV